MTAHARARAISFIDSWLEYQSRQLTVPGFVVAIQHEDQQLLLKAYGVADVQQQTPLTVDHRFGVASVSKMFTATAVLQLAEQDKLALDDRLVRYLPWLASHPDRRFRSITIRQVLRHGAGLTRDGRNSNFWQLQRPFPTGDELQQEVLANRIVEQPPGKFKYSNLGYALLGQLIEAASGMSYQQFATKHIIRQLDLSSTTTDYHPHIESMVATGYSRPFDRRRRAIPKAIYTNAFSPLFGWHTTARDLCRFMAAQYTDGLLSADSKAALHVGHKHHWTLPEDRGTDYGLGFMVYRFGPRHLVGHGGVFVGHRSLACVDLSNKLVVVILANARDAPAIEMARGIFSTFDYFERWGAQPTPAVRDRLNQRFMSFWGTIELVATTQRIIAIYPELWLPFANPEELEWIDDTTLRISQAPDLSSAAETVKIMTHDGQVRTIQYAGTTYVPEQEYLQNLPEVAFAPVEL